MEEAVETYDNMGEIDTSPDSSRHPSRASSSNRSMTPTTMDEAVMDQEAEWNKLIKPCYLKLRRYDDKSLEAKSKLTIHIRCGRVMAKNIAYAKFRKSLLI